MTTIQEPTPAVRTLCDVLAAHAMPLIVVGDKKGPAKFELPGAQFVPLDRQNDLGFSLAPLLPTGHYVRKNVGYLLAFRSGVTAIYETDDDNAPGPDWTPKTSALPVRAVKPARHNGWVNAYRLFTDATVWPRGFPLRHVHDGVGGEVGPTMTVDSPIQQLLCDVAPDVDAIWRLTIAGEPFRFPPAAGESFCLAPGGWCPFNSQATWWFEPAFPLMYLPSTCTFRMTDIWRSLIAQRCLWEFGETGVTFHPPEVEQERNPHDLMRDFEDEVPGYLKNEAIVEVLSDTVLAKGAGAAADNLVRCYEALVKAGVFRGEERGLVRAWVQDANVNSR
jgi:hypothetical protein